MGIVRIASKGGLRVVTTMGIGEKGLCWRDTSMAGQVCVKWRSHAQQMVPICVVLVRFAVACQHRVF